jgi:hypothetical protein
MWQAPNVCTTRLGLNVARVATYVAPYRLTGMSDLRTAINVLRKRRADAFALLTKYDQAIAVLEDLDREDGVAPLNAGDTIRLTSPVPSPSPSPTPPPAPTSLTGRRRLPGSVSVLSKVRSLLDEGPKAWTASEIIEQYSQRGDPIMAADPGNAIRTAFSNLYHHDEIVKVKDGVYRSAKFPGAAPPESASQSYEEFIKAVEGREYDEASERFGT